MVATELDINDELSIREAGRLVARLFNAAHDAPIVLRGVLLDLPDDDLNVLRGVLRMTKERAKQNGERDEL